MSRTPEARAEVSGMPYGIWYTSLAQQAFAAAK